MRWSLSPSPWRETLWMRDAQIRKTSTHWLHILAVALVDAAVGGSIVDDALSDTTTMTPMTSISALSDAVALVAP